MGTVTTTGASTRMPIMKIRTIPYSRLLKLEVQNLANDVLRIVSKHNPKELLIDDIYNLLHEKGSKIDRLVVQYGAHPITKKLKRLRELRTLYIQAIRFEIKKVAKLDETGQNAQVLLLEAEISRFLDKLYNSKNEIVMHQKIKQFINEVEHNQELFEAMTELNFMELLGNLEIALSNTVKQLNNRTASIAQRPKLETVALKSEIVESVKYLFSEIELAQLRNPSVDYSELIDELNQMLRYLGVLVNRRLLYNQRKAQGLIDEGGDESGNNSDAPTDETNAPLPDDEGEEPEDDGEAEEPVE